MAHIIADLYVKFGKGDRLTKAECDVMFTHFDNLQLLLFQSGPIFLLSAREARRVRDELEQYMKNRMLALKHT